MKTNNLIKKYGEYTALNDISLDIKKGKITSFIGPNGAGKSTMMHLISRLVMADSGSIQIEDKDLHSWQSDELAKHLAILTQENHLEVKLTVEELVAFGRFPHSKGRLNEEDKEKIEEAISYLGLNELRYKFIDQLSGGERQRAFIAMVIAQDSEYILLDEPTNNLDIVYTRNLMQTIRKLCDELHKTVIIVLHEINYAAYYSDYICAFKDAKIFAYGPVKEVMKEDVLQEIYGVPFELSEYQGKPIALYY